MTNVLVTGGAGFIGSHLAERLVGIGHKVRILDDFSSGKRQNLVPWGSQAEILEADIRSHDACVQACRDVEVVFHLAALASVPASVDDPATSDHINIGGTLNILRAARECRCRRVVYASSSSVYGNSPESPKHESMRPTPVSPYAVQKLAGETYCQAFYHCYGLQTVALRYFNVFGPRQDPAGQYAAAIAAFVSAVTTNRQPTVYGDGEQTRDFTFIDNVVDANLLAMQMPRGFGEVFNIACGEGISINEVLRCVHQLIGKALSVRHEPPRPGDVRHSTANIALARSHLGFVPGVTLQEGLRRTLKGCVR